METVDRSNYKQRADLTFKANKHTGRHGWLRLTPAYSLKLVDSIMRDYPTAKRIIDPFSGTGTTTLCAAELGKHGVSFDINPFLVWLGNTKLEQFKETDVKSFTKTYQLIIDSFHSASPVTPPPIHNIERWWHSQTLELLCRLKSALLSQKDKTGGFDLLMIAFLRTQIEVSNAAFNHQSMSFKNSRNDGDLFGNSHDQDSVTEKFRLACDSIARSIQEPLKGRGEVILGDSRSISKWKKAKFDLVITSPPYPNRISYIRELRPYMYWADYLNAASEAGELDWKAIGGTWGTATSKLNQWESLNGYCQSPSLQESVDGIARCDGKNGVLLSKYVWKYFDDVYSHFASLPSILNKGARLHYIVGNSTFYGVHAPSDLIYTEILRALGYQDVEAKIIRKRNSKKELYEFDISATCP